MQKKVSWNNKALLNHNLMLPAGEKQPGFSSLSHHSSPGEVSETAQQIALLWQAETHWQ